MKTRTTNWCSSPSFGGNAIPSRWSGRPVALTDHCIAVIVTCAICHTKYVATPDQPTHCEPES